MAIDPMKDAEREAERLRRQRAILCEFSGEALRSDDLDGLLQKATEAVSDAIGVELVKVLELLPDGDTLLVRAGVGWKPGVVGHATFRAHRHSPGGYALETSEPVISDGLAAERRFEIPALLKEHGVRSMVNVVIRRQGGPWGVLEVDSPRGDPFGEDDAQFLQNYANLLGAAIERLRTHQALTEAVARGEILLAELRHRVTNILANVRALAERTREVSSGLDDFAAAFDTRLAALARTQDLLARGTHANIAIRDLLGQELEAHGAAPGGRSAIEGPELGLPPQVAQALGMAFHELATNASKHGALAQDAARLDISWAVAQADEHEEVVIRWRETGVPIQGAPERRGLGFRMIERGLPYMVGGTCTLAFHPDGLECTIRFPKPLSEGAD